MSVNKIEEIQNLIHERLFEKAQKECENYLTSENPSDHEIKSTLHLLGSCYYLQGQLSKAIECFKKILSIDPKHTDAAISLSIIYNDIGRYEDAKRIYQVANQSLQLKKHGNDSLLDRKFAIKHVELGDLYFKFHRYDDALDDYSKAIKLDPKMFDIRIKLAKVYAKKGFTTRAIQELQQLAKEHEGYLPARIQLGLMYFSLGNMIDAQLEWERVRKQDPLNPEIQTYLQMVKQATETSV